MNLSIKLLRSFLLGQQQTRHSGVKGEAIWISIVDHVCLFHQFLIADQADSCIQGLLQLTTYRLLPFKRQLGSRNMQFRVLQMIHYSFPTARMILLNTFLFSRDIYPLLLIWFHRRKVFQGHSYGTQTFALLIFLSMIEVILLASLTGKAHQLVLCSQKAVILISSIITVI